MLDGIALHVGVPAKVADAIVATGNARVRPFGFVAPPGPHKVTLTQIGATVITGNLQISIDNGVTFRNTAGAALDLIATPASSVDIIPGVQYRFDVVSLTTTPADIYAIVS